MTLGDVQQPLVGNVTVPLVVRIETEEVVTRREQVLQRGLLQVDAELVEGEELWFVRTKMFRRLGGCWYTSLGRDGKMCLVSGSVCKMWKWERMILLNACRSG